MNAVLTRASRFAGKPRIGVSFEFFPPKTEEMEKTLWESIERLAPLDPNFVSVTYGAGGSTRERTHATVRRILSDTALTPAAHLTCVAATRAEIDDVIRAYQAAGVRHGDIYDLALPRDSFDVVIIHQVLHFLDDGARAIREAARVLEPAGRLLVVDFAPHDLEFLREEHAHRRLGFAPETVAQWMAAAGLELTMHRSLAPEPGSDGKIAVSLWLGRDRRTAKSSLREIA